MNNTPAELNVAWPMPPRCKCEKPQGWAVFVGPGAGNIVCMACGLIVRPMTAQDWDDF